MTELADGKVKTPIINMLKNLKAIMIMMKGERDIKSMQMELLELIITISEMKISLDLITNQMLALNFKEHKNIAVEINQL